ncbi:MAG: hypothetical protein CM1200mP1_13000 [Candidatus Neomarinimicrobiota bacterium]|nr:MAG: hypothetical protein CM1200mP1_13000 [Candidatus Neomarinimicrobiota bacterium]
MDYITSINIACGGHAGDYNFMKTMIRMGIEKNFNSVRIRAFQIKKILAEN